MTSAAATPLALDGELTIYRAHELKAQLLEAIVPGAAIECDLSAVTELDSSGVQLLLLARRSAAGIGATFRLGALSPVAAEVVELLSLADCFAAVEPAAA